MSNRALKKLTQGGIEKDLGRHGVIGTDQSDEDECDADQRRLNPFDLLNQQSFSESEVKEDDNETEHASTATNLAVPVSKKKKKKRKKKSKNSGNHISSEDNENVNGACALCVVGSTIPTPKVEKSRITIDKTLMAVELKHLNPQIEMRRTFGKRVVKLENKRGRQKLSLKTTYMVSAKESWPPVPKNLITMKDVANPTFGCGARLQWYTFEHSQYYQNIQDMFLPAVERTDSDFLINLIKLCPYHVDSLIQLSELCKITEDFSLAAELIERAVLVLELALHPTFSLTSGHSRLEYRRRENRAFFIVLFKHAQYLEARACCRTAFEITKLIWSFSPDSDPLAVILILDYYALRSKQFAWLIEFYEEYETTRNLSQLPNMAYSYALALYTTIGECQKSDEAFQYALLMFPGVLRPLLQEMALQADDRVAKSDFFKSDISSDLPPALHQLICLYVQRAKVVWRQNTGAIHWMERNVNIVLDCVDNKNAIVKEYSHKRTTRYVRPPRPILRHVVLSDFKEAVPLASFLAKERESIVMFDPLPPLDSMHCCQHPTAEHRRPVSVFFESLLPSFALNHPREHGPIDPLLDVPPDEYAPEPPIAAAAIVLPNNPQAAVDGGAPQPVPQANGEMSSTANAASNAELEEDERQLQINLDNANPEDIPGSSTSYRELTQSLTSIVDAMRDFLQNFRIAEQLPRAAEGEENGSSEEDTSDYFD